MNNTNLLQQEQNIINAQKQLSVAEQEMVNQRITATAANPVIAWLLWLFLGTFGAHRFYLKKPQAVLMLVLEIVGYVTTILLIGWLFLLAMFIWWIVDAFSIHTWLLENRLQQTSEAIRVVTGKTVDQINAEHGQPMDADFTDFSQPQ